MDGLKGLDDVAFVRFASVYRNFGDADDFRSFLTALGREEPLPEDE
jgi:transcriptional repressor NrdR